MSFAGGGSDLPTFYRQFGGAVVSTAIDKFVYINVNQKFDDWIRLDLKYIDDWPLTLDVIILFRTIPAVVKGSGAS